MSKGYIYKYTFPDGKVYIGQTRRPPELRHREHFDKNVGKANPRFWEAYQNVGQPTFEIIETIECERVQDLVPKLNETETKYIKQYKSTNPQLGYNIRERANVSVPRDAVLEEEFRRLWTKCAETWYPTFYSVQEKCFHTLEPLNEEELAFCNEILKDNIFNENGKKDLAFDLHHLKENSEEALFFFDEALSYGEMVFRESMWDEIDKYIEENKKQILAENKPENTILKIDKNGNVIAKYIYPSEIREDLGKTDLTNVYNALEGKQKHAYGYIWKYKKDFEKKDTKDATGQLSFDF